MPKHKFPFICTAARRGQCPETGRAIHAGDRCAYYPHLGLCYHETSRHFADVAAVLAVEEFTDDRAALASGADG